MTTKNAKTTAKKTTTKKTGASKAKPPKAAAEKPTTITTVKKGDLYETKGGVILEVTNGRLINEGEQGSSFAARVVEFNAASLKADRQKATDQYYLDELVRKLSKKDYEEWIEVNRREAQAIVDAAKPQAKEQPTKPAAKEKVAKAKPKPAKKDSKLSAIDAAAKVLAEAGHGMRCKDLIDAMATKGYWTSPGGKTPAATLYSAILREINTKGAESRFKKLERGLFAATT